MSNWWLVKWYVRSTTTVRTDWYRGKDRAARVANKQLEKGNIVTELREVSGNGKTH